MYRERDNGSSPWRLQRLDKMKGNQCRSKVCKPTRGAINYIGPSAGIESVAMCVFGPRTESYGFRKTTEGQSCRPPSMIWKHLHTTQLPPSCTACIRMSHSPSPIEIVRDNAVA